MEINLENVLEKMLKAASNAFGDGWKSVEKYAPVEFKKIGLQIIEIAENVSKYKIDKNQGYSAETGKILLQMQRNATEGVLVAISTLTLAAVHNAINAIFKILKDTFKGAMLSIL